VGSKQTITWSASNVTSGRFFVFRSTNGGSSWDTLADTLHYSSRSYLWEVSAPAGTQFRIKVANVSDTLVLAADSSNGTFTIVFPSNQPYVVDSVRVGTGPYGVAITPDGADAYVTCSSFSGADSVYVIATAQDSVVAKIPGMSQQRGIVISPNGAYAYVANENLGGAVTVIATTSRSIVTSIVTAVSPSGMAVSPDGHLVYAVHSNANFLTVIDAATRTVRFSITGGGLGDGVAVRPDNGRYVYSTKQSGFVFGVLDTLGFLFQTYPLTGKSGSSGIAFRPSGSEAYIAHATSGNVSVVTTANNQEAATVTVGGYPTGMAMTPNGQYAYVTQYSGNSLAVLSTASRILAATVSGVGSRPLGLAVTPSGRYVYVAANGSNRVYVVYTNGF
jgi:YVTN family beta-propeller protein